MEANNNALVIFSGGQDSTTCLFWAIRNFDKVWALTFSYGQKHVSEVEAAERIAREAGVAWEHMDVPMIGTLAKIRLPTEILLWMRQNPRTVCQIRLFPGVICSLLV